MSVAPPTFTRFVADCPECHETCGWCAWYRKNAREAGCGLGVPTGFSRASKRRCEWGNAAKGVPCSSCDGSGKVLVEQRIVRSSSL